MPDTLALPLCPYCHQPIACRLADQGAGPCDGAVQGYYTRAGILVHLCTSHAAAWDTHAPTLEVP
jgi:hypothetical protein